MVGTISFPKTNLAPTALREYLGCCTVRSLTMLNDTKENSTSECVVCCATHDDEIHEATLRIHRWFRWQVTRNFEQAVGLAPVLQPELVAT
jgi:hypothetical protein